MVLPSIKATTLSPCCVPPLSHLQDNTRANAGVAAVPSASYPCGRWRTLIRNAFGTSLSVLSCFCLFSFEQQQVSLCLSRFVSFSAAAAGAAWLFGDACLFLSSFAPCDDGPAKFCPCFKNCSVLNFLLFGFIIRTRTHTHTHVQARVHTFRSRRNYKFHVVVVDLAIILKLLFIKHRSIRFYIAMTAANLRL